MSRVAVVGGGRSVEHDVSLASGAGVAEGLAEAGHSVLRLTVDRAGGWHAGPAPELTPLTLPAAVGVLRRCDVVFPAMHGPHGEDGELAALCEVALVPYVGCGVGAGAPATGSVGRCGRWFRSRRRCTTRRRRSRAGSGLRWRRRARGCRPSG